MPEVYADGSIVTKPVVKAAEPPAIPALLIMSEISWASIVPPLSLIVTATSAGISLTAAFANAALIWPPSPVSVVTLVKFTFPEVPVALSVATTARSAVSTTVSVILNTSFSVALTIPEVAPPNERTFFASAKVPLIVVAALIVMSAVVLASSATSSAEDNVESVTVIVKALPVPVRLLSAAKVPSERVAVTLCMEVSECCDQESGFPSSIELTFIIKSEGKAPKPDEFKTFMISVAVPVIVAKVVPKVTGNVVTASYALSFVAGNEASLATIVNAWPVPVSLSSSVASLSEIVAVIFPVLRTVRAFCCAAVILVSVTVKSRGVVPEIVTTAPPPNAVWVATSSLANTAVISALVPVREVAPVPTVINPVAALASIATRSAAETAPESVIVIGAAVTPANWVLLRASATRSVLTSAAKPATVGDVAESVIFLSVAALIVFKSAAFTVVSLILTVSLPRPTVVAAYRAFTDAASEAVIPVILLKSAATEDLATTEFNAAAVAVVSLTTKENLLREVLVELLTAIAAMLAIEVSDTDASMYVALTALSWEAWVWLIAPTIFT